MEEEIKMSMYGQKITELDCLAFGPSMTKQSFRKECDIDSIVAKAKNEGFIPVMNGGEPFYGDVSNVVGYKEALDTVRDAEGLFGQFDASIRERFKNDPGELISFLEDQNNKEEAIKLGLIAKKQEQETIIKEEIKK